MYITIACNHSYEPWSPDSLARGIGGSEQAVIHMAQELTNLGNVVHVYNSVDKETIFSDVIYSNIRDIKDLKSTDILIVWRTGADILEYKHIERKKTYLWMHDMVPQDELIPFVYFYDKILVLSDFHRKFYPKINDERMYITSNGVSPVPHIPLERNPFKMVYTSAYDRGIVKMLESWTKIKLAIPEAELHIMYGWAVLDAMHHDEAYLWAKEYITRLFDQEGVYEHGRLSQAEVNEHVATSQLFTYPCYYPETSCIGAMQAQTLGAVPVVIPNGALGETVKAGVFCKDTDDFITNVIRLLSDPKEVEAIREFMTYDFSWGAVAKKWNNDLCTIE